MKKTKVFLLFLFFILGIIIFATQVNSQSQYSSEIPGKLKGDCLVCHITPGGARNSYGNDFENSLKNNNISFAISSIENLDSDKDGFTNKQELENGTYPGNANSFPIISKEEKFTNELYFSVFIAFLIIIAILWLSTKTTNIVNVFLGTIVFYFILVAILGIISTTDLKNQFPNANLKSAHSHIALVGFVSTVIVGAMYQIVPTLLGNDLYSKKLAENQFWLMVIGTLGVFIGFFSNKMDLVFIFGSILTISVLLFAYIMIMTILKRKSATTGLPVSVSSSQQTIVLSTKFFIFAIIYFLITVFFGLFNATGKSYNYFENPISAHSHIALSGFVSSTIMGALYQMFPMLSLKEFKDEKLGNVQFYLINIAVIGLFFSFLYNLKTYIFVFGLLYAVSVLLFAFLMFKTVFIGKKPAIDISVKYFIVGIIYFMIAVIFGILISIGFGEFYGNQYNWILAHTHIALFGFVSLIIVGSMYHLLPMLIWMEKYSDKLGVEEVPAIKDLFSEKLADILFFTFNIGILGMFFGFLFSEKLGVSVFGTLLFISIIGFAWQIIECFRK